MPTYRATSSLVLCFVCLVVCLAAALSIASCAGEASTGESGSLSVSLQLRGGIEIDQVTWKIDRVGVAPMNGTINTSAPGSTPSVEVFGLQPGEGYSITMAATSALGEMSCGGSADFAVESGVSTHVMVLLNCEPPKVLGGVRANGEFNVCADLVVVVVVAPLQISVGDKIELLAVAEDAERDPIEYRWETTGGSFDDPTVEDPIYTCEELGNYDVSVAVSDDGFDPCTSGWTIRVTCEEGGSLECESDQDCRTGEVCADNVCVPDVECRFNMDCGADEICVDQVCVPDAECHFDRDCGSDEICVDHACVPDVECHFNLECDAGEICVDHVCISDVECNVDQDCDAGETCIGNKCVPDVECNVDQDCDAGETCIGNKCVPDVECNVDQDCDAGEICVGNVCVPGIECAVDQDCDDSNECTVATCIVGTGQCNTANVQNGTPCDDGEGICVVGVCRTNDLFGTDFVIVFEANYLPPQVTLFLSGPQTTLGTVSIPSAGFSEPFLVTPGNVTQVALPPGSEITSSDVVERKAAPYASRLPSRSPCTDSIVYREGTDAFAALPTAALGQRYRVMAWTGGANGPSQLAIGAVPASDGDTTTPTTVTITPAAAAGGRPAGVPYSVVLSPFDAYQLRSSGDLTGSLIQADRPIAVYAGNRCANIPTQMTGFCDHVVEQLNPVPDLGH